MKKLLITFTLLAIFLSIEIYPQLAKDSWSIGGGISYPRMMSLWSGSFSGIKNGGGYLTLQRNFSEHVALRLAGRYAYMETEHSGGTHTNNLFATDFDLLYYFVPCEDLSPYFAAGFGGILFSNENSPEPYLNVTYYEYQFNLGIGAELRLSDRWSLRGEGIYHTSSTNKLDGQDDPGMDKGLFGGNSDTYITLSAGVQFYFSKGEPSDICDLPTGITTVYSPTLEEIEELIKKYIPKEVVKEVVVEKLVEVESTQWVLVGVNFEFNSTTLKPESYTMLYGAVQYLNQNPDIKIEIQGHTDNVGSESYNQQLSEKRAASVKEYLVSKGIGPARLTIKGYGESVPVADNNTPQGRTLNRRIEFKVIQ
jgi:OOP family OmpA-OmpF porin